jgi:Ca2+-binding RTX toxin-like protein
MTKLVGAQGPVDFINWNLYGLHHSDITSESPTQFVIADTIDDEVFTFTGKHFTFDPDGVTGGVVNRVTVEAAGHLDYTLSGMKVDVVAMRTLVGENDLAGLDNLLFGGDDSLRGSRQGDGLTGMGGADTIDGGLGNDTIYGGLGGDLLTGGRGADVFGFTVIGESAPGAPDEITDLEGRDHIDLSEIDANTRKAGDQAFRLVSAFTHHAGQAVLSYDAGADRTSLMLDVNGDGAADATIFLDGDHSDFRHFVL